MKLHIVLLLLITISGPLNAQIASWDFNATNGASVAATSYSPQLLAPPTLTVGPGLLFTEYNSTTWDIYDGHIDTTLESSILNNSYLSLNLSPMPSMPLSVSSISIQISRLLSFASMNISLFSSIDGFTSGAQIGPTYSITSSSPTTPQNITFDTVATHSGLTSNVAFRFYLTGTYSNAILLGSTVDPSIKGVIVNGTVVPEVATVRLFLVITLGLVAFAFIKRKKCRTDQST